MKGDRIERMYCIVGMFVSAKGSRFIAVKSYVYIAKYQYYSSFTAQEIFHRRMGLQSKAL